MIKEEIKQKAFKLHSEGLYWDSVIECMRALVLDPKANWIYYLLGINYHALGMSEQALPCLELFNTLVHDTSNDESIITSKNIIDDIRGNHV